MTAIGVFGFVNEYETEERPIENQPISSWPGDDRPREKIGTHGSQSLSDVELLAVVLGSGATTARGPLSAVSIARQLLMRHKNLRQLSSLDTDELRATEGVGPALSARLVASFEIGRRIEASSREKTPVLRSPTDVAAHYAPAMRDLHREIFRVVLLSSSSRVIRDFTASEGGLAASIVEPRIVFRRAILCHAASMICLHNHPSGNLEPSVEDLRITRQLVAAGRLIGIEVRDHIIIAGDGYTSLAERGHI